MTVADNAVTDDEAETGAGADGFRGKKRFEHVRLHLRWNARAVIDDFDDQLIVFQRSADADLPGAIDGMNRVIDQVGPNLVEFAAISHDARQGAIESPNERHVFQFV